MAERTMCAFGTCCIAGPGHTQAPASPDCPWERCAFHCKVFHTSGHPESQREAMMAHLTRDKEKTTC